jgi:hypothetical protein
VKVDHGRIDIEPRCSSTASIIPPAGGNSPAPTAFAAALDRHRQREATRQSSPRRSEERSPRRTASGRPEQSNADFRIVSCTSETVLEVSAGPTLQWPRMILAPSMRDGLSAQPQAGAVAGWKTRWRRSLDASPHSSCIEVAHLASGARFLLSRDNGVWLLSFQAADALPAIDLQSLAATLRAHFAGRGLGPIDILF